MRQQQIERLTLGAELLHCAGFNLIGSIFAGVLDSPNARNTQPDAVLPKKRCESAVTEAVEPLVAVDRKGVLWGVGCRRLLAGRFDVAVVLVVSGHKDDRATNGGEFSEFRLEQP